MSLRQINVLLLLLLNFSKLTLLWLSCLLIRKAIAKFLEKCISQFALLSLLLLDSAFKSNSRKTIFFIKYTFIKPIYFLALADAFCALITLTTIFCSSMRKARMIFSLTHLWHNTPPYALFTVFFLLQRRERSCGRAGWMPLSLSLHWPHLGTFFGFLRYWYTSLPPGVRTL